MCLFHFPFSLNSSSHENDTLVKEARGRTWCSNDCTDHPSGHIQCEQYLALPIRYPIDRHWYICARVEIHVSYVCTVLVPCVFNSKRFHPIQFSSYAMTMTTVYGPSWLMHKSNSLLLRLCAAGVGTRIHGPGA